MDKVGTAVLVDAGEQDLRTKICPQCGQELFEDMDVCYGCLYDFTRDGHPWVPTLPDLPPLEEDEASEVQPKEEAQPVTNRNAAWTGRGWTGLGVLVQTGDVDLTVPLPPDGLMVGRIPTSDIVLHSRAVSREHALIVPTEEGVIVHDQGATNPVILRGREVTDSKRMETGDTLNICGALLTLVERGMEPNHKS